MKKIEYNQHSQSLCRRCWK